MSRIHPKSFPLLCLYSRSGNVNGMPSALIPGARSTRIMLFFLLGMTLQAQDYSWRWTRSATGANAENGNCVATDRDGNVFVAGYFYSPLLTIGTHTLSNSGNYDVFIAKYDSAGTVQWVRKAGGSYDDVALGLATNDAGDVYVTGYFYSPLFATATQTLSSAGAGDLFVIKYDASGNELWARSIGGSNDESGNGIACDRDGHVIVTGYFLSGVLTAGSYSLQNAGGEDLLLLKLDADGNVIWAKSANSAGSDHGNGVGCDNSGNIYLTGTYAGCLSSSNDTIWSTGGNDAFVAQYDPQGNCAWMRSVGGDFTDSGYGVTVHSPGRITVVGTSNSSSLVAGSFSLSNAGNFDLFVIHLSSTGNIIWARQDGGVFDDTGYAIVSDETGNVFVTGHSHSPMVYFGADTLVNNGVGDVYVAAYSPDGSGSWLKQAGGSADDGSSGLAIDPWGNVLVSGYFLSPTVVASQCTLTNSGGEDLFLGRLAKHSVTTSDNRLSVQAGITAYPNPTSGTCYLTSGEPIERVELFDANGRYVKCATRTETPGVALDLSSLPNGFYLARITGPQSSVVKKIIRN